ncbi:unnamed protein product, partial [Darwinula stevensoni]
MEEVWKLHCQLSAIPSDLRGIGIQATRLEADDMSSSSSVAKQQSIRDLMTANAKPKKFQPLTEVGEIDLDVLAQLPPDIQDEIHKEYHLPKKTKVQQSDQMVKDQGVCSHDVMSSNPLLRLRSPSKAKVIL